MAAIEEASVPQHNVIATLKQALADLEGERQRIDEATTALRSMLAQVGDGPGRPAAARTRRKPRWTPAMKAAARARMQKYWAGKKKRRK